jgi:hypothetical protein
MDLSELTLFGVAKTTTLPAFGVFGAAKLAVEQKMSYTTN